MPEKKARKESAKVNGRIRKQNRGTGIDGAEYSSANPGLLLQAVTAITKRGCAVQFGLTKDEGAFCVRIVGDGDPYNEYTRATEDFDVYLQGLISDFEAE